MKKIFIIFFIFIGVGFSHAQRLEYETIQINYLSLLGLDSIGSSWGTPKKIPCYIDFTMGSHISLRVTDQEGKVYYKYDNIPFISIDYSFDNNYTISFGQSIDDIDQGVFMLHISPDMSQIDFHNPAYEDDKEREKEIELKCANSINQQRIIREQMDLVMKNILSFKGETVVIVDNLKGKLKAMGYED